MVKVVQSFPLPINFILLGIVSSSSMASSFGTWHHSSCWSETSSDLIHRRHIPNHCHRHRHLSRFSQSTLVLLRGGSGGEEEVGSAGEVSQATNENSFSATGSSIRDDILDGTSFQQQQQQKEEPQSILTNVSSTSAVANTATRQSTGTNKMGPNASPPGFLRKQFPSFPWHALPNVLTYARCIAIPALILQFYTSQHVDKNIHSALIFSIASITDYLDGYLARRWDICSPFGAFLDPVADKLMVSTALILLSGKYGAVVALPCTIILAREIAVSALREWMASRGQRESVKVGFQGKCKTALTMMALTVILAVPDSCCGSALSTMSPWKWLAVGGSGWEWVFMKVGMAMLYLSALVTVTSGSVYFKAAAPVLLGGDSSSNVVTSATKS